MFRKSGEFLKAIEMKKVIFIAHRSEIIRRGLQATLRKYFNAETTLLKSLSELKAFTDMTNLQIIIVSDFKHEDNLRPVHHLEKNNQVTLVELNKDISLTNSSIPYTIDLNSSGDEIQKIISDIFTTKHDSSDQNTETGDLTYREKEVLKLVALGFANKEIAEKLFLSVHTVISHRKNITEKLGIKSISGLTVYAILNKIIDPETMDPGNLI